MTHFTNVRKVVFEFFTDRSTALPVVRMISFDTDADTGAMSVEDIMEANMDNGTGVQWVARVAAEYTTLSDTDVEYTFRTEPTDSMAPTDYVPLAEINTGKTRLLQNQIFRAMTVVSAQEA
jgi:hypothetical protein